MDLATKKLKLFLNRAYPGATFKPISGDASPRRYFRVKIGNETQIACVYPLPFERHHQTFLLATDFFSKNRLPVPKIYHESGPDGIILMEDFGEDLLADWLDKAGEKQMDQAIRLAIDLAVKIQALTDRAIKENASCAKQKFDFDKLFWELQYFFTHYLLHFKKINLAKIEEKALLSELGEIAKNLSQKSKFLVHRDYHIANLMVISNSPLKLGLIDYQDARIGPASYDLVPLLTERLAKPLTDEEVERYIKYFLAERGKIDLTKINPNQFTQEFWLADLQRALKVLGTFGYMSAVAGRAEYRHFITGTLKEALRALEKNPTDYPMIRKLLT